jgi:hypothetical protein
MGKPPKPITQYSGSLSPQQIADGMNAAVRNAKRLLADAQTLYDLNPAVVATRHPPLPAASEACRQFLPQ